MITIDKDKAVELIVRALAIHLLPLLIIGSLLQNYPSLEDTFLFNIFVLISLGLFLSGYYPLIKSCRYYMKSKGYSPNWSYLCILSIVSLGILSIFPDRKPITSIDIETTKNPFKYINLLEIIFLYFVGTMMTVLSLIYLFFLINQPTTGSFIDFLDHRPLEYFTFIIIFYITLLLLILRDLKRNNFVFKDFIPNFEISWTIVVKLTFIYSIFGISFGRLIYYWLSFIFPNYIENIINYNRPPNFTLFITEIFLGILIFPIPELIISLILQKQSIRWNNKKAILFVSILFSVINLSPYSLVLFLNLMIWSILFYKTANLINIFILQIFIDFIFSFVYFISYKDDNFSYISTIEYQNLHQPFLILYSILAIISVIFIIDFIYKNFPKEDDLIPYYRNYRNRSKLSS